MESLMRWMSMTAAALEALALLGLALRESERLREIAAACRKSSARL